MGSIDVAVVCPLDVPPVETEHNLMKRNDSQYREKQLEHGDVN